MSDQNKNSWLTKRPYSPQYFQLLEGRKKLPVFPYKQQFMRMLDEHRVILVEAETGSGKTTQIPQWCLEYVHTMSHQHRHKRFKVICTQPRRIAATTIAHRVAKEMDVTLGEEVGYHVRFEKKCSEETLLLYATDGVCFKKPIIDKELLEYAVVVLDEVHERNLATDALMGLLKTILEKRNNLRIVVMSASATTAGDFRNYWGISEDSAILAIPGRLHPVEIIYYDQKLQMEARGCDIIANKVLEINRNEPEGDILVFLAGQDEIEQTCGRIQNRLREEQSEHPWIGMMKTFPLYSALPGEERRAIFQQNDPNVRRCIVSTNIAESSVTIDGIVYVIDSGEAKREQFDAYRGVFSLGFKPVAAG